MRQTDKYHFNLIETSDTFSPDPLNENAQAVEAELAALTAVTAAADAALEKNLAAQKAELSAADAALEKTAANNKTALEQSIASAKSTLQTAIGSGGKTARIKWGSYVGNGNNGKNNPNSLTFDFKPHLVVILKANSITTDLLVRDAASSSGTVTWGDRQVSWYSTSSPSGQMNANGIVYYYVVIGESL